MRRLLIIGALVAAVAIAVVVIVRATGSDSSALDAEVATAYVDAQANALCLVQSTAFTTQVDLEAAYESAVQSSELSKKELEKAETAAKEDVTLRTRISDQVAAVCG